ncbi:hypothetical protein BST61_g7451 [Cercospora zeina]
MEAIAYIQTDSIQRYTNPAASHLDVYAELYIPLALKLVNEAPAHRIAANQPRVSTLMLMSTHSQALSSNPHQRRL